MYKNDLLLEKKICEKKHKILRGYQTFAYICPVNKKGKSYDEFRQLKRDSTGRIFI